jgi:hypothetical protein
VLVLSRAILADFPSEIPKVHNRFSNQDEALNDDGYDSEGNLPYFADEDVDNMEGYNELPIDVDAPTPPPTPSSTNSHYGRVSDASSRQGVERGA